MSAPERLAEAEPPPAGGLAGPGMLTTDGPPARAGVWREPLFWLALALALGRFACLARWSLWEDEVFTVSDARLVAEEGWRAAPKSPLGYFVFAAVVQFLGPAPSEAGLRLVPAVLGFLGIGAVGVCFAPVFGARRAAAAALILAASSWHLYWSQNARFYTLSQDLCLIGGALALRAVFRPPGERALWPAATALAAMLLAALAQPSAAMTLPAWVAALVVVARLPWARGQLDLRIPRSLLWTCGILALGVSVWAARIWWDYWRAKHELSAHHLILTSGWYFTPALLGAAAFALFGAWRARHAPDVVLGLLCTFTALVALLNALFLRAAAQYLFVLLPFVALLATWPLTRERVPRAWRAAWLAALVLPGLADQGLYFFLRHGDRPPWKAGFAEVLESRAAGDLVFTNCANVGEYYFEPSSPNLRQPTHVQNIDRYNFTTEEHWARHARREWFVINRERLDEWPAQAREGFLAMLASDARLVKRFEIGEGLRNLDVEVYLRE